MGCGEPRWELGAVGMLQVDDARKVLAAWQDDLVTDSEVAAWAAELVDATPVADLPEWLLALSMYGVREYMCRPKSEILEVPFLAFAERLTLRALPHLRTVS